MGVLTEQQIFASGEKCVIGEQQLQLGKPIVVSSSYTNEEILCLKELKKSIQGMNYVGIMLPL